MAALISRDPFAREELHRESVSTTCTCDVCGSTRKGGKLFRYFVEEDQGRTNPIKGLFCSVGCMRIYHGG
jgi:hypothetical protein